MQTPTFNGEVREQVYAAQHGHCKLSLDKIDDFHHIMPNTVTNQKLLPLFLQSVFNCVGLSRAIHDSERIYELKITMEQAMLYEDFLASLATVCYNLGAKEGGGNEYSISVSTMRERKDLSQITAQVLSE